MSRLGFRALTGGLKLKNEKDKFRKNIQKAETRGPKMTVLQKNEML
jgi:hypothetical protein